ncbi:MAG: zf-TFIIB domain-containing protein [Puniceicoccaceae bacterium]
MKCPRTGTDLKTITISGITVDFSEACGGVWFDNYELIKFDEAHEQGGAELVALMEQHRNDAVDLNARLHCPKCKTIVMARHFYSPLREIEIDRCPNCGGVWLDAGELAKIRENFPSQCDRERASQALVDAAFADPAFQAQLSDSQAKVDAARKFAHLFAWLCPSRYLPGKQDGAAF